MHILLEQLFHFWKVVNTEDKNKQMIISPHRFPEKNPWLEQEKGEQNQNLSGITKVPIEIFSVRRLDQRKILPV